MSANPISGPYTGVPSTFYHSSNPGKYNRTILASATFYATGSNAKPSAFYVSSSAATVTLVNGGQITIPAAAASTPAAIYEMSVYSVDSGAVYLLYR